VLRVTLAPPTFCRTSTRVLRFTLCFSLIFFAAESLASGSKLVARALLNKGGTKFRFEECSNG
jgi:hypothetical protein